MSEDVEALTDAELGAIVYASGHGADGAGPAWKYHLMTCPTCSATAKLTRRIVRARVAEALAPIEALHALAHEQGSGRPICRHCIRPYPCATLRAARREPPC